MQAAQTYLTSSKPGFPKWMDRVGGRRSLTKLMLDLNSSVSGTYGRRERHA